MVGSLTAKFRWINKGHQVASINVENAEKHYKAEYVADLCVKLPSGNWSDEPVAVFYQPNPDRSKGHTHYFGLFLRDGAVMIMNAESAVEGIFYGSEADDGEIIFSRFRHDYRTSKDGSTMVDGGRDYGRGYGGTPVMLRVVGADFEIVPE